jgi:hypothetical protein
MRYRKQNSINPQKVIINISTNPAMASRVVRRAPLEIMGQAKVRNVLSFHNVIVTNNINNDREISNGARRPTYINTGLGNCRKKSCQNEMIPRLQITDLKITQSLNLSILKSSNRIFGGINV